MSDVLSATFVTYKLMADGTLRASVDIEPGDVAKFHKLVSKVGTALALAALKPAHLVRAAPEKEGKGGAMAKLAGIWCNDPEFIAWTGCNDADEAAQWVREAAAVQSRAEFDNDADAAERFQVRVRGPYMKHCEGRRC